MSTSTPSSDNKTKASELKEQGNKLYTQKKWDEASQMYTQAIELDASNAVYWCNRAACYIRLKKSVVSRVHTHAIWSDKCD